MAEYQVIDEESLDKKSWKVIGAGGFGQVYKARHIQLRSDVAIKLLCLDDGSSSDRYLLRECELMRRAESPRVIQVLGVFRGRPPSVSGIRIGLVMELMERGSLASLQRKLNHRLPWSLVFRLAHQVSLGMEHLHSLTPPIIHKDLKPDNVLLDAGLNVKITDFGLSRFINSCSTTSARKGAGTTSYMPPEAFSLSYKSTPAFDVYSYGILLCSIVKGTEPYETDPTIIKILIPTGQRPSLEEVGPEQTPGLEDLVKLTKRCWHQEPNERPLFPECTAVTETLYEKHKPGMKDAVHQVLTELDQWENATRENEDITQPSGLWTAIGEWWSPPREPEPLVVPVSGETCSSGVGTMSEAPTQADADSLVPAVRRRRSMLYNPPSMSGGRSSSGYHTTSEAPTQADADDPVESSLPPAVRRRNTMELIPPSNANNLPQHWDAMPVNTPCQTITVQRRSPEYNEVLTLFRFSCTRTVIKIERIQNKTLWKSFQIKKQDMEQRNGHTNNERRLFHGTCQTTIDHISNYGFNRSFAGMNVALYGNGTYFAVRADYAAQDTYSKPDAQGQKFMYLCRVLTGDYALGKQHMIVPPAKSSNSTVLYDSVVNNMQSPALFVIFHDSMAYPEYLITFRRIDKVNDANNLLQHWDAMPVNTPCQTITVQPRSPEYNEVLTLFSLSCTRTVIKIERIQNKTLWKSFQIKKQDMEQRNGHTNNEKRLFHGTCPTTVEPISNYGFNRSYAGMNAACYGNGTYFSVRADYCAQDTYSKPDARGQKFMFLCRVLTGDYTLGKQHMIVPPVKSSNSTVLYDSVVNNMQSPAMFIIFHDSMAYPEYLITFK